MFNPLYIEIYQFVAFVFAGAVLSAAMYRIRETRKEAQRLQNALSAAMFKARLAQLQRAKLDYPEDWALRGQVAEFEGSRRHLHPVYRQQVYHALRLLDNAQLADIVLQDIANRLSYHRTDDKVFTRLAGRIFRAVEKSRKSREVPTTHNA